MTPAPGTPPDLLAQGDDAPPRRLTQRSQLLALLLVAAVAVLAAAAVLVRDERAAGERRRQAAAEADAAPRLSLRADQEGTPRGGPRPTGVRIVVANDGPADVRLLSGRLAPGAWHVVIPDGTLQSHRSVSLELTPPPGCTVDRPRLLELQTQVPSGRTVTSALDVTDAPLLYGGHLADAVAAIGLTCDRDVPGPPAR